MNVYLLRHGPAAVRSGTMSDMDRPLTADGRTATRLACRGLRRLGIAPKVVLTSPAKRALETAEIAAKALGVNAPLTLAKQLCPGARPESVLRVLKGHDEDVLIVGHEPDLSDFAAFLLGLGQHQELALAKAGALALAFKVAPEAGGARLLWYLRRKQLARLGA